MEIDLDTIRRNIAKMTDGELQSSVAAEHFTEAALGIARDEMARRGLGVVQPPPLDENQRFAWAASIYRAPRVLTGVLVGMVIAQLGFALLTIAGYAIQRQLIADQHTEGLLFDFANSMIETSATLRMVVYIASIVVLCFWLHRMYRNLPAVGSSSTRFSPGGAVGSLFIPFVNLVRGFQVVHHLWVESQPPSIDSPGYLSAQPSARVVGWWWAFHLAASILSRFVSTEPKGLDAWVQLSYVSTAWLVVLIVAGVLFLAVVRGIARRQRDQWDDLVRRQPVAPSADRLR